MQNSGEGLPSYPSRLVACAFEACQSFSQDTDTRTILGLPAPPRRLSVWVWQF